MTKEAMMRAAEKLIAAQGMENVSIRDIVNAAGQRNESALQYHFKNLNGLIDAILLQRSEQTHAKRAELIEALQMRTSKPSLREVCMLMVQPSYELARSSAEFRNYIKAFGHQLVLTETSPLTAVTSRGGGGTSGIETGHMLKSALPHLDGSAYQQRLEAAIRLCSASMYHHVRQANAFKGAHAELFIHSLADALEGLLSAPVSEQTQALARKARPN